jgi:UDP-N-acetylmuramoyl-L-alanyl-D-glutamate--2,6-diaminopimelate ligase
MDSASASEQHGRPEGRRLKELLARWSEAVAGTQLPQPPAYDGPDVWISGLTEKTAEVTPGAAFVARVRETSDGHPYIGRALAAGAVMILAQRPYEDGMDGLPHGVAYVQVQDTAVATAWLAAAWEGFPSRELVMIGITGTDGKTSTAGILFTLLREAGIAVGLLSTIKAVIGATEEPLAHHVTTPEAPTVQHYLRRMVDAGLTHCILESTSHGLAQQRVGAIDFDVAVVTNITHEHLDYHGDYAHYLAAKALLFERLNDPPWAWPTDNPLKQEIQKTAVLNHDDGSYAALAALPAPRQLSYALEQAADVRATAVVYAPEQTRFTLLIAESLAGEGPAVLPVTSPLTGEFNVYNMSAAATAALALGLTKEQVARGLAGMTGISGRMERIDEGQPYLVLVDFAHTPNALEKAITAVRHMTQGRVITVFGSAGKRDVAKRRMMAETSARHADLTVLTAEDPRTEALADILQMMAEGCASEGGIEGETFWRVPDRGEAIYFGLRLAEAGDTVLICGKGHEQSMCFGTVEYPWDDREATRLALRALRANEAMPHLGLPTSPA